MHLGMLLQMAADGMADRVLIGGRDDGLTTAELAARARRAGTLLAGWHGDRVVLVDLNSEAVPILLLGSGLAGKPFVPVNYRLSDDKLRELVALTAPATVVVGEGVAERLGPIDGIEVRTTADLLAAVTDESLPEVDPYSIDPEAIAVLLFTSGTTGDPKAAVLRHRNLASYVLSTVEFAGCRRGRGGDRQRAAVPHRRDLRGAVVALRRSPRRLPARRSTPAQWVDAVRVRADHPRHGRAHDARPHPRRGRRRRGAAPHACAPSPTAAARCRRRSSSGRWRPCPTSSFVNAYGLTETSSTDRPARPRRPPRGVRQRRSRRAGPARLGGPAAAQRSRCRSAGRRASRSRRASAARSGCGASRSPGSTSGSATASTTAGSPPATPATSTTTGTCSCTAGSTT